MIDPGRAYWDRIAARYQDETHISCRDIHYGPLIPGDSRLKLLPAEIAGRMCLELGCGAGQNSICLASRGAFCVAVDTSVEQLRAGQRLARRHQVEVRFVQADLGRLPLRATAGFDVIHSAYALPFLADQRACILRAADLLRPGGWLVLSTAHPVSTEEWVSLDGQSGIFLPDYFHPSADRRTQGDHASAVCRPKPLGTVFSWFVEAGLRVDRVLEPEPLPVDTMSVSERDESVPYWSEAWVDCGSQLARVPSVAIFRARKPRCLDQA